VTPSPRPLCPACGGANACAAVAAGRFDVDCWCRSVKIDATRIAELQEPDRGRACLCRDCVTTPKHADDRGTDL
jgi:hypothetical protein